MLEDLVEKLLSKLKEIVSSETVVGEPISMGEVKVVPITKIFLGFGAGGGEPSNEKLKGSGVGLGGGAIIEPVAVITIFKDDVKVHFLKEKGAGLEKISELIPQVLDKIFKTPKETPKAEAETK